MLCLAEADLPKGKVSFVRAFGGGSGGGGGSGEYVHTIEPEYSELFPGTLEADRTYLAYVEGDQKFTADRTMSVTDIARHNKSNYLVVEVTRSEMPADAP